MTDQNLFGKPETEFVPTNRDKQALALYEMYPRRQAKFNALKAFKKALELATFEEIRDGILRYAKCTQVKNCIVEGKPNLIKLPATWANHGCWEDEYPETPAERKDRQERNRRNIKAMAAKRERDAADEARRHATARMARIAGLGDKEFCDLRRQVIDMYSTSFVREAYEKTPARENGILAIAICELLDERGVE